MSERLRPLLQRTIEFVRGIGIPCEVVDGASGFLPNIRIVSGGIQIDPKVYVGDVLHEVGHLAIMPGRFRSQVNDNVDVATRLMMDEIDFSDPDHGEANAALQCGDTEATAWAWAAGEHIGLSPSNIIRNKDYFGEGRSVRTMLLAREYMGIHGLAKAGFCVTHSRLESIYGRPAYPKLAMWLQRDFVEVAAP